MPGTIPTPRAVPRPTSQRPLGFLSVLSLLFYGLAGHALDSKTIDPTSAFLVLGLAIATGLVVTFGLLEELFGESVTNFKAIRFTFAATLMVVAYVARASTLEEVNSIFHVGASALPMTVAAGTVLYTAALLFWPFVAAGMLSLAVLLCMLAGRYFSRDADDIEKIRSCCVAVAVLLSCACSAAFVHFQLAPEDRAQRLYLLAHSTDFSKSFRCAGLDEHDNSVLFLNADHSRILVAPKPTPLPTFEHRQPDLMKKVVIPNEFEVRDCLATIKDAVQ